MKKNAVFLSTVLFSCVLLSVASEPVFFSNDPEYILKIPVPALGLEGPYLEDINNCGPYLGDINGNGMVDIVVRPWGDDSNYRARGARFLNVFFNRNGRFGSLPDRVVSQSLSGNCIIGDFNADGKADLAVAGGGEFKIYFGKLDFSGHVFSDDTRRNADGLIDVPYGLSGHGTLEIELDGIGASVKSDFIGGTRWRRFIVTASGGEITNGVFVDADLERWVSSRMADMDGDGCTDVVVLSRQIKGFSNPTGVFHESLIKIRVYYGPFASMTVTADEAARYSETTLPGCDDPTAPLVLNAVADMNNNGYPDVVFTYGDETMILYQQPGGGFAADPAPAQVIKNSDRRVAVADINRNGFNDLVICRAGKGVVSVLFNSEKGVFPLDAGQADEKVQLPGVHSIAVADMNSDGWQDIVAVANESVYVIYNNKGGFVSGAMPAPEETDITGRPTATIKDADRRQQSKVSSESQNTLLSEALQDEIFVHVFADDSMVDTGCETSDILLMPFYTGVVYPTPQEAEYMDEFISVENVGVLVGNDIDDPSPIVDVLIRRIENYGGKAVVKRSFDDSRKTWILLGTAGFPEELNDLPAVPDKPEGYLLAFRKVAGSNVIVLSGRDRFGMLWAVTSFGQLVHRRGDVTVARAAEIVDYPESTKRGYMHTGHFTNTGSVDKNALFTIFFRLNSPGYKHLAFNYGWLFNPVTSWRNPENQPENQRAHIKAIGDHFTPLGIRWFGGMHPMCMPYEYRLSGAPEDIDVIMRYAEMIAAAGGDFYLQFDDHRFCLNPFDEKAFGTARRADAHILNAVYDRLNRKYPETGLVFCPPFYWGPLGGVDPWYGEQREDYLAFAGKHLRENIVVQWTGARVKSAGATPEQLAWITGKIRRKPAFWQNMPGAVYRRLTNPVTEWQEWLYDGFMDKVDGYYLNCYSMLITATLADYMWNPQAYDPDESIRQAVSKLAGVDVFERLNEADELLLCFDKHWDYIILTALNRYKSSHGAAREIDALEANLAAAQAIYDEVFAGNPRAAAWLSEDRHGLNFISSFVKATRADPALVFHRETGVQIRQAQAEAGYVEETDMLFAACDFDGGHLDYVTAPAGDKRAAVSLSGREPEARVVFSVPHGFSDPGRAELVLSAKTGSMEKDAAAFDGIGVDAAEIAAIISETEDIGQAGVSIAVKLNGHEIFSGKAPFFTGRWSAHSFEFERGILDNTNTLTAVVLNASDKLSMEPAFSLNYSVLKMRDAE